MTLWKHAHLQILNFMKIRIPLNMARRRCCLSEHLCKLSNSIVVFSNIKHKISIKDASLFLGHIVCWGLLPCLVAIALSMFCKQQKKSDGNHAGQHHVEYAENDSAWESFSFHLKNGVHRTTIRSIKLK